MRSEAPSQSKVTCEVANALGAAGKEQAVGDGNMNRRAAVVRLAKIGAGAFVGGIGLGQLDAHFFIKPGKNKLEKKIIELNQAIAASRKAQADLIAAMEALREAAPLLPDDLFSVMANLLSQIEKRTIEEPSRLQLRYYINTMLSSKGFYIFIIKHKGFKKGDELISMLDTISRILEGTEPVSDNEPRLMREEAAGELSSLNKPEYKNEFRQICADENLLDLGQFFLKGDYDLLRSAFKRYEDLKEKEKKDADKTNASLFLRYSPAPLLVVALMSADKENISRRKWLERSLIAFAALGGFHLTLRGIRSEIELLEIAKEAKEKTLKEAGDAEVIQEEINAVIKATPAKKIEKSPYAAKQAAGALVAVVINADSASRNQLVAKIEASQQFDDVLSAENDEMAQRLMLAKQESFHDTEVRFIKIQTTGSALTLSADGLEPKILDPQADINDAIRDYLQDV